MAAVRDGFQVANDQLFPALRCTEIRSAHPRGPQRWPTRRGLWYGNAEGVSMGTSVLVTYVYTSSSCSKVFPTASVSAAIRTKATLLPLRTVICRTKPAHLTPSTAPTLAILCLRRSRHPSLKDMSKADQLAGEGGTNSTSDRGRTKE